MADTPVPTRHDMKRSDISDQQVVEACMEYKLNVFSTHGFALDILVAKTGAPYKVAEAAMKRAVDRGLIDYGVSLRTAWATEKGRALSRVTISQQAGEYERYAPDAFDSAIGSRLPLRAGELAVGYATLTAAEVASDGRSVHLTIDVPFVYGGGSFSLGFEPPP